MARNVLPKESLRPNPQNQSKKQQSRRLQQAEEESEDVVRCIVKYRVARTIAYNAEGNTEYITRGCHAIVRRRGAQCDP